ncbi:MAG TPA: PIN domain-containing protein [Candidatus Aquilonibacter sp.]|nr:PIN domain-containing protein [Candidatus Aquilonibacter sp.]
MRWFFDSSVLVSALLPDHEHHARSFAAFLAASPKNASCAAHSLAEVYATLTRYPGKERLHSEQAALLLQEIERRLTLVWLDGDEYRVAIHRLARMGIVGGAVYDGLLAACALKVGARHIYTWNVLHFNLLDTEIQKLVTMPPMV